MASPTAWHAEFRPLELAPIPRAQNFLHLTTYVRHDTCPPLLQSAAQWLRQCCAKQDVNMQLRYAADEGFFRERTQGDLPPVQLFAVPAVHNEQMRRRVEDGRDTFLPDWNGDGHGRWLVGKSRTRGWERARTCLFPSCLNGSAEPWGWTRGEMRRPGAEQVAKCIAKLGHLRAQPRVLPRTSRATGQRPRRAALDRVDSVLGSCS